MACLVLQRFAIGAVSGHHQSGFAGSGFHHSDDFVDIFFFGESSQREKHNTVFVNSQRCPKLFSLFDRNRGGISRKIDPCAHRLNGRSDAVTAQSSAVLSVGAMTLSVWFKIALENTAAAFFPMA